MINVSASLILVMCIFLLTPMIAFGDDYYDSEGNRDEDELVEEIGELMGWVAIALAAVPVALYPTKEAIPIVVRRRKGLKKKTMSLLAILKKLHMPVGITVFFIVAWHGVLLFWAEGEFGLVGWIGTVSLLCAVIGGMFGTSFAKKRKAKSLRSIHIGLLTAAIMMAAIHVLLT